MILLIFGNMLEKGRVIMSLYGENALNAMMMDLADAGIQFTQEEALCYGQYVFQKVMSLSSCVVSPYSSAKR